MRLRRLDQCLILCWILSVLWFLGVDQLMVVAGSPTVPTTCDNQCRMRNIFYDDGGKACSYYLNPDCYLCKSATGLCVVKTTDQNTTSGCPLVAGAQRVCVNLDPNSCNPLCPYVRSGLSEANFMAYLNDDTADYHKCQ